jgi:diadenylate cyclase
VMTAPQAASLSGIDLGPPVVSTYVSLDPRRDTLDAIFGPVASSARCAEARRHALEEVLQLAVEVAREGREGRKIGTLFVVGEVEQTLRRSRPLLLDPLYGHAPDLLQVSRPDFRETVKELAQLDGAFLVDDEGTFAAACRYIEVDVGSPSFFMPGLGTRHAAAASITAATRATAIVVSQSSIVRVFSGGEIRAEIVPELFLMSREQLFTPDPAVRQLPEAGITVALADEGR